MPTVVLAPSQASGSDWFGPAGAAGQPGDGQFAQNYAESGGAIALWNLSGTRPPSGATIAGVQAQIRALMGSSSRALGPNEPHPSENQEARSKPGASNPSTSYQAIEAALTLDGSTAASSWRTALIPWAYQWRGEYDWDSSPDIVIGGSADLWGLSISQAQASANGFGILIRRKGSHPGQEAGDVFLDAARLAVTYTESGEGGGGQTAMSDTIRNFCLLGPEATLGESVTPTRKPNSFNIMLAPAPSKGSNKPAGQKFGSHHPTTREHATGSIEDGGLGLNYTEINWLLRSVLSKGSISTIASGVYQRQMRLARLTKDDFLTYNIACGDAHVPAEWEKVVHAFVESLDLSFGAENCSIGGSVMSRKIAYSQTQPSGANEVQTMTFGTQPSGGTLKLMLDGVQSAAVNGASDMASALQTALEGMSNIGAGNVTVALVSGTVYTITFAGTLAGKAVAMLEVPTAGNALTSATTVTIAETTRGGYKELDVIPVLPGHWQVWVSDTLGGLGESGNLVSGAFLADVSLGRGRSLVNQASRALDVDFTRIAETDDDGIGIRLTGEKTGSLKSLSAKARSDSQVYVRVEAVGPQIGSTGYYNTLRFDMACKVDEEPGFGDTSGVRDISFDLKPVFDASWGNSLVATTITGLAEADL